MNISVRHSMFTDQHNQHHSTFTINTENIWRLNQTKKPTTNIISRSQSPSSDTSPSRKEILTKHSLQNHSPLGFMFSSNNNKQKRIQEDQIYDNKSNNSLCKSNNSSKSTFVSVIDSDNDDIVDNIDPLQEETVENIDIRDPRRIHRRVHMVVYLWGPVQAIPPDKFLLRLLECRGYDYNLISAVNSPFYKVPTQKQINDYNNELLEAVRASDLVKIKDLYSRGYSMSACNRYSESIVHMACRRSSPEVVDFILKHGGNTHITDDFGRTPLHDACWRLEPRFDIVTMLLDHDLTLLRLADIRGSIPLCYVRQEHWAYWCAYFFHQKEKYWAVLDENVAKARAKDVENCCNIGINESFASTEAHGPLYWLDTTEAVDKKLQTMLEHGQINRPTKRTKL